MWNLSWRCRPLNRVDWSRLRGGVRLARVLDLPGEFIIASLRGRRSFPGATRLCQRNGKTEHQLRHRRSRLRLSRCSLFGGHGLPGIGRSGSVDRTRPRCLRSLPRRRGSRSRCPGKVLLIAFRRLSSILSSCHSDRDQESEME
jgi:hypothetical protein